MTELHPRAACPPLLNLRNTITPSTIKSPSDADVAASEESEIENDTVVDHALAHETTTDHPSGPSVASGSDGPDGHSERSPNHPVPEESSSTLSTPEPIVLKYGEFFEVDGNTVVINQIAVAAKFAEECQILFDDEIKSFRKYEASTGQFAPIKEATLKWVVAEFIRKAQGKLRQS